MLDNSLNTMNEIDSVRSEIGSPKMEMQISYYWHCAFDSLVNAGSIMLA